MIRNGNSVNEFPLLKRNSVAFVLDSFSPFLNVDVTAIKLSGVEL